MKKRATKKTFRKAGFSNLSCKYLTKKANGTKTRTKKKPKTIAFVCKGKIKFAKATTANKKKIKKKGYKSESF